MKKIKLSLFTIIMIICLFMFTSCNLSTTTKHNKIENEITNTVVKYEEMNIVDFENAVQVASARVEKAVVGIELKQVSTTGSNQVSEDGVSVGSGVIYKAIENKENDVITSYTYYVVTNRHVILDDNSNLEKKVYIYLGYEDLELPATLIAYEEKVDLACLTFTHTTYIQPVEFGDSSALTKGSFVIAVGNPEGFNYYGSVTFGIISAPLRYMSSDTDNDNVQDFYGQYIQHDASINPGNSGGGLFTIDGRLVGINTLKLVTQTNSADIDNMGFAIPSNEVKTLLFDYLEKQVKVERPRLGVTASQVRNLTPAIIEIQGLKALPDIYEVNERAYGLYVVEVTSGGSMDNTGIKKDDIILTFDGYKITTMESLAARLNSLNDYQIGNTVEVTYYSRDANKIITINITLKGGK